MPMKAGIEWALVADAQRCRILERRIPLGRWQERTEEAVEVANPPSRELGTERPGRTHESSGTARHAIEPKTDPHRQAKQDFARLLADRLEARAAKFDRLLLVAPPAFLGDLREALGEAARRRLAGTLDKDLTRHKLAGLAVQLDAMPIG